MIVVDVGCMTHGDEESVLALVRRFRPAVLYGFDAHPELVEGIDCVEGTVVVRRRLAAWTHDGVVPLYVGTTRTGVHEGARVVPTVETACFDLAAWLRCLPHGSILKLDVEGAEYPLLARIAEAGVDELLDLVLVEWHDPDRAHGYFAERPSLACRVEDWH